MTEGVILLPDNEYVVPSLFVTLYGISTVICAEVTNSCFMSAKAGVVVSNNIGSSFYFF